MNSDLFKENLKKESLELLKQLIRIQSFSKEEDKTADKIELFLQQRNVKTNRKLNNIWAYNRYFDSAKPTLLLNSHHDTVKPNSGYIREPYDAVVEDGKFCRITSPLAFNDKNLLLVLFVATDVAFNCVNRSPEFPVLP